MDNMTPTQPILNMTPVSDASRSGVLISIAVTLELLATVFFLARVYSRAILLRTWKLDDTLLSIAWLFSWIIFILTCLDIKYGVGRHVALLSTAEMSMIARIDYAMRALYVPCLTLTKLSICIFYLNIMCTRLARYTIDGCIVFLILCFIAAEAVYLFQCQPVRAMWSTDGHCMDLRPALYLSTAANIITDVWIMAIIVPSIFSLDLNRWQKTAVFTVVSLGWLAVAACLIRAIYVSLLLANSAIDGPWYAVDVQAFIHLEIHVGLICASTPAIQPLLYKLWPEWAIAQPYSRPCDVDPECIGIAISKDRSSYGSTDSDLEKGTIRSSVARADSWANGSEGWARIALLGRIVRTQSVLVTISPRPASKAGPVMTTS